MKKTRINSIVWLEYWREDLPHCEEIENTHWNSQDEILEYLQNKYHACVLKFSVDFYASWESQPEDSVELRHLSVDTELSDISEAELWNLVRNEGYMEKHAPTVDSEKFEGSKAIRNATEACGKHKSVWKPFEEDGKRFVHIETWNVVWTINREGSEVYQKMLNLVQKKVGNFKEVRTFLAYSPETFENTDAIRSKVFDIFAEK